MRHILTATVMNEPGVLAHVANMFSARGFNIDSLVVGRTEDPNFSRMTIVVTADERTLDQVRKQLAKIVTVVKVRDYKETPYVSRDLMLIKLSAASNSRSEIIELAALFRGRVVDVGMSSLMVELSGEEEKLDAFVELVRPYGIRELARTGVIAMSRGAATNAATDEEVRTDQRPTAVRAAARQPLSGKRQPTQQELEATPPG
ncbi:MAG: acetolactate synthase small subunit [Phycisphaerae bacterium]|nr:acetolactate synthase small subunit [Phycisphaerae bacterium]